MEPCEFPRSRIPDMWLIYQLTDFLSSAVRIVPEDKGRPGAAVPLVDVSSMWKIISSIKTKDKQVWPVIIYLFNQSINPLSKEFNHSNYAKSVNKKLSRFPGEHHHKLLKCILSQMLATEKKNHVHPKIKAQISFGLLCMYVCYSSHRLHWTRSEVTEGLTITCMCLMWFKQTTLNELHISLNLIWGIYHTRITF